MDGSICTDALERKIGYVELLHQLVVDGHVLPLHVVQQRLAFVDQQCELEARLLVLFVSFEVLCHYINSVGHHGNLHLCGAVVAWSLLETLDELLPAEGVDLVVVCMFEAQ